MTLSNISGFPRIGGRRELKFALEDYWAGRKSADDLNSVAQQIRRHNWTTLRDKGVDLIPSNDFNLYDQMLATIALVGAVPARYGHAGGPVPLDTYFAMARGRQQGGVDVVAMEMTKWFNTNYHYLVPELTPEMQFSLSGDKPWAEFLEAKELGIQTVPVLVGPVSFLLLAKAAPEVADFDRLSLLPGLLEVYEQVVARLAEAGAEWIQFDEPVLVQQRSAAELAAVTSAYGRLSVVAGRHKLLVKTYFDHAGEAMPVLAALPVEAIGLDFVYGPTNEQLLEQAAGLGGKTLFAGVVDGHNVWINDLARTAALVERLKTHAKEVVVSTSCSLQHVPVDLAQEPDLDPQIARWLAFALQKVDETVLVARMLNEGPGAVAAELAANAQALRSRQESSRTTNAGVRARLAGLSEADFTRTAPFEQRTELQQAELGLPLFPTTTIGSFPQTDQIRAARAALRTGKIDQGQYEEAIKKEIADVVKFQLDLGLDVLVHGEPERNDMVQYFAEQLDGYLFTRNAWVQSYGSRCVRPPILYGDISRPVPMTVEWMRYAQSLTDKPIKGMLTGPVTMLMWSFVRDDQPLAQTAMQMALAIRDEVKDLEAAGFQVIQVDEAALREGLPLRQDRRSEYLDWAVRSFRLTTSGVADRTNIQMHMCYSEFGDIIEAIDALDADVALIEASRSNMELLGEFSDAGYARAIGPGVYDIHSPRVPSVEEMADKLRIAASKLGRRWIWVNPDCGLKTRGWAETEPSLKNMVAAALELREEFAPVESTVP
ncbi:MAG: 5-methyltetrahydropteroyltriglutamate--homocysteine S-methyltransferase [Actinomycetota bacterium]